MKVASASENTGRFYQLIRTTGYSQNDIELARFCLEIIENESDADTDSEPMRAAFKPDDVVKPSYEFVSDTAASSAAILPIVSHGTTKCFDIGSDSNLIKEDRLAQLGIPCVTAPLTITTVNGSLTIDSRMSRLDIFSLNGAETMKIDQAFVVPHFSIYLPAKSIGKTVSKWKYLEDLPFHDIGEHKVYILIGSEVPNAYWALDQRLMLRKQPYAVETTIGWVLIGPTGEKDRTMRYVNCLRLEEPNMFKRVRKMYYAELLDTNSVSGNKEIQLIPTASGD